MGNICINTDITAVGLLGELSGSTLSARITLAKSIELLGKQFTIDDLKATELYKKLYNMYGNESDALAMLTAEMYKVMTSLGKLGLNIENKEEVNAYFNELMNERLSLLDERHKQLLQIRNGLSSRIPNVRSEIESAHKQKPNEFYGYGIEKEGEDYEKIVKDSKEYAELMFRAREFEEIRKRGEIDLQEINELIDVFIAAFRTVMKRIANGENVGFPTYELTQSYNKIKSEMNGDVDNALNLLVKNKIGFNSILQTVINNMKGSFLSSVLKIDAPSVNNITLDQTTKRLYSNLLLFERYKTNFLLLAQPKLQSQLKLKVPITFLATNEDSTDYIPDEESLYDQELDDMIADLDEPGTIGVNDKLADGDNTVVSRDNYSINILTIDLKRSLSRELSMRLADFQDSATPLNRYGGRNYHDPDSIYRTIMSKCYDVTNSGELLDRIASDVFDMPWKERLLDMLTYNDVLRTQFFNAICTSFNRYIEMRVNQTTDDFHISEANMLSSNEVIFNQLHTAVNPSNPLLKENKSATKDEALVIKNAEGVTNFYKMLELLMDTNLIKRIEATNATNIQNKYYYIQGNDKRYRLYYNGHKATLDDVTRLYTGITIEELFKSQYVGGYKSWKSLFEKYNLHNKTIEEFFDYILNNLGYAQASGTKKMAKNLLMFKYNVKVNEKSNAQFYGDRINFLSKLLMQSLRLAGGEKERHLRFTTGRTTNERKRNDSNMFALKKLAWLVNGSLVDNYEFTNISGKKAYQTHTYCSHLMLEMYKLRHKSIDELKAMRQQIVGDDLSLPLKERNCDIWEGEFFDQDWYHSWRKDIVLAAENNKDAKIQTAYELFANGLFDLHTFQVFNDTSWADINMNDYMLASFYAFFFKYNDEGVHFYAMPQMEDKGTEYFISQRAYSAFKNKDGYSSVSQAEASIFMKELSRIRRTYLDAVKRGNNKITSKKHECRLKTDGNGNITHELELGASLNDARFHFLGSMNRLLEMINLSDKELNSVPNISDNEKTLVRMMRQYIYSANSASYIARDPNVYRTVEDIVIKAAQVLHDEVRERFERNWDASLSRNAWAYALMLYDYKSGIMGKPVDIDGRITKAVATYLEEKEKKEPNDKVLMDAKDSLLQNEEAMKSLKEIVFFQYYNQQHATHEMLNMFTGDVAQYGGLDTATKRLSQFVSSGIVPDSAATGTIKNVNVMVVETFKMNTLDDELEKALLDATVKDILGDRNPENLTEEQKSEILNDAWAIVSQYQDTDPTDGQSIMSIDFLAQYLKSIGRLPKDDEEYLKRVKRVYTCKDSEVDEAIKDLKKFANNHKVNVMNTLKTHTLSMSSIKIDGMDCRLTKAVQIKTALMLALDIYSFTKYGKRDKNNLMYKMQRIMNDNDVQMISFDSALKVYIPGNPITIEELEGDVETVSKNFKAKYGVVSARKNYMVNVSIEDNLLVLETPSHYLDNKRQLGIQMIHLITQSINPNEEYIIDMGDHNEKISGEELYGKIDELWKMKYEKIYERIMEPFSAIDKLNLTEEEKNWLTKREVSKLLLKELNQSESFSYQSWYSLQLDEKGNFMSPINTSSLMMLVQKLVFNKIKKELVAAPTRGGYLVQTANIYNFRNNDASWDNALSVERSYDKDGKVNIIAFEVDMPLYDSKLVDKYLNKTTGEIDMEAIRKEQPELLDLVCYRIPTEGYCSMYKIRVRRFTDPQAGGNITLPSLITKVSGSDFDIDKLFFFAPAVDKNGKFVNGGTDSEAAIDNYLLGIYKAILASPSTLASRMRPQGFEDIEELDTLFKRIELYRDKRNGLSMDDVLNPNFPIQEHIDTRDFGDPMTQASLHVRNSISKNSVGIFANPNTLHALLMHFGIKVKADDVKNLSINDNSLIDGGKINFSSKYCADGYTNMGTQLRQPLGASVDDAKNPRFAYLNINLMTADFISTLIQMGFTLKQAVLIINQPIAKLIVALYGNRDPHDFAEWLSNPDNVLVELENEAKERGLDINIPLPGTDLLVDFDMTDEQLIEECADNEEMGMSQRQVNNILPLLVKTAKIANEFRLLTPRLKCDNAGKADWTTVQAYVAYTVTRDVMKDKIDKGDSQFTISMNRIFEEDGSKRMNTIETLTDQLANDLFDYMGADMNPKFLYGVTKEIVEKIGLDHISDYAVRSIMTDIMTYLYVNGIGKTGTKHPITDINYYIAKRTAQKSFVNDYIQAKQWFTSTGKYKNLFGPKGIIATKPSMKFPKPSLLKYRVLSSYIFNNDHSFRNTMSTEWEQMFYDNTRIPGLDITVREFAVMLLNYFILKNGFDINKGSIMLLLPALAINDPRTRAVCDRLYNTFMNCTLDNEQQNIFVQLFCRNHKYLLENRGENVKLHPQTLYQDLTTDLPDFKSLPEYIKYRYTFYIKNDDGNEITFKRYPWLGGEGVAKEYQKGKYNNNNETLFEATNKLWRIDTREYSEPEEKIRQRTTQFSETLATINTLNNQNQLTKESKKNFQSELVKFLKDLGIESNSDIQGIIDNVFQGQITTAVNKIENNSQGKEMKSKITQFTNKLNEIIKKNNPC